MDNKPMHIALGSERAEVWHNRPTKKEPVAIFFGPDREANAKLFIRAQHMDELVGALRRFVRWADKVDNDAAGTLAQGRAILAKIGGGE